MTIQDGVMTALALARAGATRMMTACASLVRRRHAAQTPRTDGMRGATMVAAKTIAVKTTAAMKNADLMIADVKNHDKMNVAMTNSAARDAVTGISRIQGRDWAADAEGCTSCRCNAFSASSVTVPTSVCIMYELKLRVLSSSHNRLCALQNPAKSGSAEWGCVKIMTLCSVVSWRVYSVLARMS